MRIIVIGDRDTVTGFRLAGAAGHHVDTPDQARSALDKAIASPDVGLIILTERWAQKMRSEVEAVRKRLMPLIIEIPDRRGPAETGSLMKRVRAMLGT